MFLNSFSTHNRNLFDIGILRGYIHLRFIMLSNNFITDLSPLTEMSNLQYLKADNNQIISVESLRSLRYLQYLDLSSNKLTTINNLSFPYLQYLKVNGRLSVIFHYLLDGILFFV